MIYDVIKIPENMVVNFNIKEFTNAMKKLDVPINEVKVLAAFLKLYIEQQLNLLLKQPVKNSIALIKWIDLYSEILQKLHYYEKKNE